jgi:hypothetical protein
MLDIGVSRTNDELVTFTPGVITTEVDPAAR